MDLLPDDELRVLGVLVEKAATTPEQYPLTLNAVVLGANQTSNRTPVTGYEPGQVADALGALRARGLVRVVHSASQRAERYRQVIAEAWELAPGEEALLAVLMLRGPQTANELRTRTERYHGVDDLGGVEAVLDRLANRYAEPWVVRLARQHGQREERWVHLAGAPPESPGLPAHRPAEPLGDGRARVAEPTVDERPPVTEPRADERALLAEPRVDERPPGDYRPAVDGTSDTARLEYRIEELAAEVALLRSDLDELRAAFD